MIVAIESASTDCSLALATPAGETVAVEDWVTHHRQGHELLPRLLGMLGREGVPLGALTAVAVGIGPGSFTGLRVGMSVAKGLAYALQRPIVGVPSLTAWLRAEPAAVAAVARAGAREAYVARRDGAEIEVLPTDVIAELLGSALIVVPTELAETIVLSAARSPRAAGAVAGEAAERLATDPAGDDLALLEPRYVRGPRGIRQLPDAEDLIVWP